MSCVLSYSVRNVVQWCLRVRSDKISVTAAFRLFSSFQLQFWTWPLPKELSFMVVDRSFPLHEFPGVFLFCRLLQFLDFYGFSVTVRVHCYFWWWFPVLFGSCLPSRSFSAGCGVWYRLFSILRTYGKLYVEFCAWLMGEVCLSRIKGIFFSPWASAWLRIMVKLFFRAS